MQSRSPTHGTIKAKLRVLMLAIFSVCTPSLASADVAPAGGCDCSQAPGDAGPKPDATGTQTIGKRRLGIAAFAVLTAGAFLYSARRVRRRTPPR